ncbi:MAG: glycosyltransferase, partial [Planctomycetaceae bacterium]|nr:glycosyltransferase [Planctomycetaceae bacterium]
MRVAHIITRLILGGAQENTLYSVDDQHHLHGDQVCLITGPGLGPEGTLIPRAMARELDVRVLQDLHRSLSPVKDMRALRAIIRQLKEFAPDVVHTHSSKAGILGRYAAHRLGIPAVHTIHGASFHYGQPAVLHWCYRQAERMAARWCQRFISVCDAMSNQYVQAGIASADKFTTIYSGMETQNFLNSTRDPLEFRRELGLHPEHVVVTKVARLFHLKGHEYLLDAAPAIVNAVPNVRFVLVGDGVLRDEFQQRIRGMGLDQHFIFTGLISPEDVGSYIHASDMVVHTSVWEGLARVLPQGSLAGKP